MFIFSKTVKPSLISDVFTPRSVELMEDELFYQIQNSVNSFQASGLVGKYFLNPENYDVRHQELFRFGIEICYGIWTDGNGEYGYMYALNKVTDMQLNKTYYVDFYGEHNNRYTPDYFLIMDTLPVTEVQEIYKTYGWNFCPLIGKLYQDVRLFFINGKMHKEFIEPVCQRRETLIRVQE